MNVLKKIITSAVLTLGITGAAHATFLSGAYITTGDPYNFTLQFAQQANTRIESAKLSLYFSDPIDYWFKTSETLTVKLDNTVAGIIRNVDADGDKYVFNVLPSLLSDGKLKVSLSLGCTTDYACVCIGQDVWLNDVLLAISRVSTVPTVPVKPVTPATPATPANPGSTTPVTPPAPTTPPIVTLPLPPTAIDPAVPKVPTEPAPADTTPPLVTLPLPVTPFEPSLPNVPTMPDQPAVPSQPGIPADLPTEHAGNPAAPVDVPEPGTLLSLGLGLLGLAAVRRRT
ncbi:PEP-CTERM sorting domain-containing protein [Massilia sp. Dwa41.01b]|uniref:PEP-CTERM sorting domain-containing protein n=1 Tax=unclassified Massilia TaxID=2609279 RepID=UPI00160160D7|nr:MULTISPECIES: PEP-CTERM sorting domain-containing protein [unclassified Massilia]QNA90607.1 PEP-CTERM sorting domain-containing protein [Massilia sp. Dwa41.01b]QNA97838.1 PEP-CTERM sorting domain-containing protein [Massilia sp. Se16.2.3]